MGFYPEEKFNFTNPPLPSSHELRQAEPGSPISIKIEPTPPREHEPLGLDKEDQKDDREDINPDLIEKMKNATDADSSVPMADSSTSGGLFLVGVDEIRRASIRKNSVVLF